MMHRTQILLEEAQYEAVQRLARERGQSMGKFIRTLVATGLQCPRPRSRRRLSALAGLFRDQTCNGGQHDEVLYGGRSE